MTPASDPLAILRASRGLRSEEEFAAFVHAIAALGERMDPADLPDLHRIFDDGTDDYGVYWSVIHLIERYEYGAVAEARLLP